MPSASERLENFLAVLLRAALPLWWRSPLCAAGDQGQSSAPPQVAAAAARTRLCRGNGLAPASNAIGVTALTVKHAVIMLLAPSSAQRCSSNIYPLWSRAVLPPSADTACAAMWRHVGSKQANKPQL
jgi:hypothetical protein